MNERIWNVLRHPVTKYSATTVIGFTAGMMAGYWRTKSQYDRIEKSLEYVNSQTDQIELEIGSSQIELDYEKAEMLSEFNKTIGQVKMVADQLKAAGEDMLEGVEYLTAKTITKAQGYDDANVFDEQAVESLREDHPSFSSKRRPLRSVRDEGEPMGHITSMSRDEDGNILVKGEILESVALMSEEEIQHRVANRVNVFDSAGDEWDYKEELESRRDDRPYIIHVDEFVNDESGWDSQSTLTWYEKDQILTDSHDTPIYDPVSTVGELRFGHGSQDPNIVYIRNTRLQAEYEVLRDEGSYQEIVLGEKIEEQGRSSDLKHSQHRRFRDD